jgi:hypothetical protein
MRNTSTIACPYCWQSIDLDLPAFDPQPTEFVIDCEVCCRPIRVVVYWEAADSESPIVSVEAES